MLTIELPSLLSTFSFSKRPLILTTDYTGHKRLFHFHKAAYLPQDTVIAYRYKCALFLNPIFSLVLILPAPSRSLQHCTQTSSKCSSVVPIRYYLYGYLIQLDSIASLFPIQSPSPSHTPSPARCPRLSDILFFCLTAPAHVSALRFSQHSAHCYRPLRPVFLNRQQKASS